MAGMVNAIAFIERPQQAAWLRVRASEFRERRRWWAGLFGKIF
jgi:hypothetical protein